MFGTASAANRVVSEVLDITYEKTRESYGGGYFWRLTRRAHKVYDFVDMEYWNAMMAAKVLVAKYTRVYDSVLVQGDSLKIDRLINLTSEIYVERDSPVSYRVHVAVNEVDERFSLDEEVEDIAAKFADLSGRDYDEGDGGPGVSITRIAYMQSTRPWYRVWCENGLEKSTRFAVQLKDSESAAWRNFKSVNVTAGEQMTFSMYVDEIGAARFVRLFDGIHESNVMTI